jgi:hypothetical protein
MKLRNDNDVFKRYNAFLDHKGNSTKYIKIKLIQKPIGQPKSLLNEFCEWPDLNPRPCFSTYLACLAI